ncbi:Uncharacterized conserved protein, DUF2236 family [Streptoalloteichus tenebrarius]|uniref:Uncharacterized conserved protein, DUF2236 family n=1 Tax=Streptoalloteichus tenebrarius (strain ATCC 17920 / DSM 40477 / JCM 4838 / CBS 697.72 / NBRC 16177 / NCIMB 11028 / NRRL B-12390 / A12253. 1 / ISP 5477) TaxID=1933 RepID=A0ABT1HT96_STRSD|nr:oxygenase MpaB family protein [Streptoalloteichus tenebrarius]MCP2258749.1 Uncharacterized conserved protein, DUF2236 family [Streptoalloteichus tenebrarius]
MRQGLATTEAVETGLFGPRSVTWQLHADPAMWVAGICSLYLQALHPLAVAGVVQNSNFRRDPFGRLFRTAAYVGVITYGTTAEAHRAAARVRAVHRALRAVDPRTGRRFRIDDPELLLWVHCAEVYSFLTVVRRAGFRLSASQADRYLAEQRRSAVLVGLRADEVPGSVAEFEEYFARMRPELRRTPESEVIYDFLHQPPVPWWLVPPRAVAYQPIGHLAYSLLPDWALELHGHQPFPRAVATLGLRAARAAGLAVPESVRWRVADTHLRGALDRLGRSASPSRALLPA